MTKKMPYKRVLLKCSGEMFQNSMLSHAAASPVADLTANAESVCLNVSSGKFNSNSEAKKTFGALRFLIQETVQLISSGVQICMVVGGGNMVRGRSSDALSLPRITVDYMGMLGTVINSLVLQSLLEKEGLCTHVLSAIPIEAVCESYVYKKAVRYMEKGRLVIFAAGIGVPYFSTDTCATLRAAETGCDAVMKITQVGGVYSEDPAENPSAIKYDKISYQQVLDDKLSVMDSSAVMMAADAGLPIFVLNLTKHNTLEGVLRGQGCYTLIS